MDLRILNEFRSIVGNGGLICSPEELHTYECDGLTNFRVLPRAVLLPSSTAQVQSIVRLCHRERIPFVARGSGTGLSGGALPVANGIVLSLARMNRIREVDIPNARVVVEPGVINLDVTGRVQSQDYFYAPDPSSQSVCSIGGNVAENAGGAHCLKYGFTTTHVLGLEVVLPDGTVVHLGSKTLDAPGYDLMGVFVGSEGTLGIATKVTLRIVKKPENIQTLLAAFNSTNEAGAAGRLSPNYIVQDGVIPRTALPRVMTEIERMSAEAGIRVANVFHAGDGNLHPLVLYDRRIAGQEKAAEQLSGDILKLCVEMGGSITGEHGVGEEKKCFMSVMFAEPDLDTMQLVRCAFDPQRLSNPDKVFPRPRLCAEKPGPYQPHPLEVAGVAELF